MQEIKFLANVNIEKPIIEFLLKKGWNVKSVLEIDKQMPDDEVCALANKEERIILTNDKDFGEIVFFQRKVVYGVILVRIKGQDVEEKIVRLGNLLARHSDKIINHFVIITKEKFRFVPLEVI